MDPLNIVYLIVKILLVIFHLTLPTQNPSNVDVISVDMTHVDDHGATTLTMVTYKVETLEGMTIYYVKTSDSSYRAEVYQVDGKMSWIHLNWELDASKGDVYFDDNESATAEGWKFQITRG